MLGATQQDVARHRAFQPRLEAAIAVEQHQALAVFRQAVHQRWRDQHVAKDDDATQMMQRHAQFRFALHFDPHRVVIQVQIGQWRSDVKGIKEGLHVSFPVQIPARINAPPARAAYLFRQGELAGKDRSANIPCNAGH